MPASKKVTTKKPAVGKYVRSAETRKKLSEAAKRQAERARKAKLEAAKAASPVKAPVTKRPLGRSAPVAKSLVEQKIEEIEQAASTGILNADKAQTTADGARRRSRLAFERADQALEKIKGAHERIDIHLDLWQKLDDRRKWVLLRDVVILIAALIGWAL